MRRRRGQRASGGGQRHPHSAWYGPAGALAPLGALRAFGVRVERFGVRQGSGGAGAQPGGEGLIRRIRFLEPMEAALLSTRRENPPRGIEGGGDALGGRQSLIDANGHAKAIPGCFSLNIKAGEAIEIETPGGGGFGPALATPLYSD